ncbi:DUF726 domain-containing protein [Vibrio parahaemolyticus]|uniref:DUF726 domain-containing protein n=1 Tax=Vibrio parahaemolyticus TaxID=670 RepID=A0AAW8Q0M9_VIBPH|nr:DUF726 domain-containing protein [Vibrio parahaemolyticus]EGR2227376.1 DUF726 domain-containing protein [Vibrio parahaemolyticus]MDS1821423.1 DUF726 domain-containing protein [Vibrio parahaemolyticus]
MDLGFEDEGILRKIKCGELTDVIVVNGFLSETESDVSDWLSLLGEVYHSNTVHHFNWEASSKLKVLNDSATGDLFKAVIDLGFDGVTAKGVLSFVLSAYNVGRVPWQSAIDSSEMAGRTLARYLDKQDKQFILMGHSLGARVLYHCLKSMVSKDKVTTAILLGGAVDEETGWGELLEKHSKMSIYNCHSDNDLVLKHLYPVKDGESSPIGLKPINIDLPDRLRNIDMSIMKLGHMEYKTKNVGTLLNLHINRTDSEPYEIAVFRGGGLLGLFGLLS